MYSLLRYWTKRKLNQYAYRLELHKKRLTLVSENIDVLHLAARWMFFNNKCCFCGDGRRTVQIDHLIPISKKGSHTLLNLFPCCKRCNRYKSAKEWSGWYRIQEYYLLEKELKILEALKTSDPGEFLDFLIKKHGIM